MATSVLVFTRDLRVADNPALVAAAAGPVVPLFVVDPALVRASTTGVRRRRALAEALHTLSTELRRRGAPLTILAGDPARMVPEVVRETGATQVHLSADVSAYAQARVARLRTAVAPWRAEVVEHPGIAHVAPGRITPTGRDAYVRFTPYLRQWQAYPARQVLAPPTRLTAALDVGTRANSAALAEIRAGTPTIRVGGGGEPWAQRRLDTWIGELTELAPGAEPPGSRLSAALHLGAISASTVLDRVAAAAMPPVTAHVARQLCWRDFHLQLLAAQPDLARRALGREPPWNDDDAGFAAWREGRTGYPLVDAGMRQLVGEGWMPNRVRMIAAAFLSKHLGIDWRRGAAVFLAELVDGDLANNTLQWQWAAGVGIDTRPGRFFDPVAQARRFDPTGDYVRRWIPELADVPVPAIFRPWGADQATDYPPPVVEHHVARDAFAARRALVRRAPDR